MCLRQINDIIIRVPIYFADLLLRQSMIGSPSCYDLFFLGILTTIKKDNIKCGHLFDFLQSGIYWQTSSPS